MKLVGHCNCGGVSYSCDDEPKFTAVCHCRTCQKQTGANASLVVGVSDAALHIDGKTLGTFITKGDSGKDVHRSFCTGCGSPIVSRCDSMPGLAFIKAGTLDDVASLTPTMELYLQDKLRWVPAIPDAQCFERGV